MTVGDERYDPVQLHFHAQSEHTIDAEQFSTEIHRIEIYATALPGIRSPSP